MSRLSTKNYKPRATGSLRHLMLKVLARHTITALYRLNYSKCQTPRFSCSKWTDNMVRWELSVSDQCCVTCNNTAVPVDTYIDTWELDNMCSTVKTQHCRRLPGAERPGIVTSIKNKHCCADSQGEQCVFQHKHII